MKKSHISALLGIGLILFFPIAVIFKLASKYK